MKKRELTMKEFGKRLLIVLMRPLWCVVHIIYHLFVLTILDVILNIIIDPLVYLFSGREVSEWMWTISDFTIDKHIRFEDKIREL